MYNILDIKSIFKIKTMTSVLAIDFNNIILVFLYILKISEIAKFRLFH